MKQQSIATLALAAVLVSGMSVAALAQTNDPNVPGHPRVNEVDQRLENQQTRIDNGVNNGKLNAKQEENLQAKDAKVSQELSADQAKHNGHVTKAEQRHMNKQLNKDSTKIYDKKHDIQKDPPQTP